MVHVLSVRNFAGIFNLVKGPDKIKDKVAQLFECTFVLILFVILMVMFPFAFFFTFVEPNFGASFTGLVFRVM